MAEERLPVLWIVIPCYNEEKVLPITSGMFLRKVQQLSGEKMVSPQSRVLFVDDGSKDSTWSIIRRLAKEDEHFIGIRQSRNRGHQNALLAGLMEARDKCDITISIDCDGQDDVGAMDEMIKAYRRDGCEIVYGVRSRHDQDTFFRRRAEERYYRLLHRMGVETVYKHADYRLVSARVLKEFANFHEVNLFLRGMFPIVGFRSTSVAYERTKRVAGEQHYGFRSLASLAFEGITSLSITPIHIITYFGLAVALISFIGVIWAIVRAAAGSAAPGWAVMGWVLCLLAGVQLISLGVIGEYVGRMYFESKHRPRYIISERTWEPEADHFPLPDKSWKKGGENG